MDMSTYSMKACSRSWYRGDRSPEEPLPEGFLREIPKTDLHVHLDGSVRVSTLIDIAKEKGLYLPSYDEAELRQQLFKDSFANLEEYLECFKYTSMVMQDRKSMERISYEFAVDNYSEGVRYFEVRFAPQLHSSIDPSDKFMIEDVLQAVNDGLKRATEEFNEGIEDPDNEPEYHYGIIVSALRSFTPQMSRYYNAFCAVHEHLDCDKVTGLASESLVLCAIKCRDQLGLPIVAFDIAGPENGYKASVHKQAYSIAHSKFMAKTVHAGESFGPESIFQAVNDCHAERIGHGYHLFSVDKVQGANNMADREMYVRRLIKYICDRRVCLEVCLTSNLNTMPGLDLKDHAISQMLEHNVSFCLNTDNRLMSQTTMSREICLAVSTFDISPKKLRYILVNGFKRAFFLRSYVDKCAYVRKVLALYDRVAAKYGVFGDIDDC